MSELMAVGQALMFDEFAAAAKQLEHITDCTIEACSYGVQITTEAYMANDDGSRIERGRGLVLLTMDQTEDARWSAPGPWLLRPFERGFEARRQGFTRYATQEEIACYKSAEQKVATC